MHEIKLYLNPKMTKGPIKFSGKTLPILARSNVYFILRILYLTSKLQQGQLRSR